MTISRTRSALAVVAAALVLTLTACAGGGGSGTGGAVDAAVLGPDKPATGEPVKVGFISTGRTQALDYSDEMEAVQATVEYANAKLGGLAGRPIELLICEEHVTPAEAEACGNRMVTEGVAAVVAASPPYIDYWLPQVRAAGIPVMVNLTSTKPSLETPGVFALQNGAWVFGGAAAFAERNGFTRGAIVVPDLPGSAGTARVFGPRVFDTIGGSVDVVAIMNGTPDMTPMIQAAENTDPQLYHVIGDPNFCSGVLRAIKSLGLDTPLLMYSRCLTEGGADGIEGGYRGVTVLSIAITDPADPEYQIFAAVLQGYGSDIEENKGTSGYQAMLAFVRGVNANPPAELTAPAVEAAIAGAPAAPFPLGGGSTFQCNGTAAPSVSPNICLSSGFFAVADEEGGLSDFSTYDSSTLFGAGPTGR
jgi:ABC-type branched-subunit amino acid transport system substrate-binding protein